MIVYIAGLYTSNFALSDNLYRRANDVEKAARRGAIWQLESYHYVKSPRYVEKMRRDKTKVFLDSGAFSAFTQGVHVDLDAYCKYVQDNKDIIVVASVLDAIGDPLQTYNNQKDMEKNGIAALPCFHYGEDERYLKHYLDNYEYITLGGMVPIAKPQLRLWLDRIWSNYLIDDHGRPRIKVHGFGLTQIPLMARYPWYSVDSSSWIQIAMNGAIMIPGWPTIHMSRLSPMAKVEGRHFSNFSPLEQAQIALEVNRRNYQVERMADVYYCRWTFNMLTYTELTNTAAVPPPFIKHVTFF